MIIDINTDKIMKKLKEHCKNTNCSDCDLDKECNILFDGLPFRTKGQQLDYICDSLEVLNNKLK